MSIYAWENNLILIWGVELTYARSYISRGSSESADINSRSVLKIKVMYKKQCIFRIFKLKITFLLCSYAVSLRSWTFAYSANYLCNFEATFVTLIPFLLSRDLYIPNFRSRSLDRMVWACQLVNTWSCPRHLWRVCSEYYKAFRSASTFPKLRLIPFSTKNTFESYFCLLFFNRSPEKINKYILISRPTKLGAYHPFPIPPPAHANIQTKKP